MFLGALMYDFFALTHEYCFHEYKTLYICTQVSKPTLHVRGIFCSRHCQKTLDIIFFLFTIIYKDGLNNAQFGFLFVGT